MVVASVFSSTALYYALFCSTKTYRAISSDLAVVDASGIVAYSVSGIHAAEKREEGKLSTKSGW